MTVFEMIFFAVLSLIIAARLANIGLKNGLILPGIALLALVALLSIEDARWTMYPAYAAALLFFGVALRGAAAQRPSTPVIALSLAALSAFLVYALPVPVVPAPRGPYTVGTMTWQFDDIARKDPYAPTPDQPRKIMLQVWYPADIQPGARPATWNRDMGVFGPAIARKFGLPSFLLNHLALVQSHAYADAPLKQAADKWPVVVYSHGWTGYRSIALDEVEGLASRGYVVFAPDHIYGALATVLKDGTPVLNNPKAMPPDEPKDAKRQAGIELLVDTYAGDLRFVLDTVEHMDSGESVSPFKDRLDLAKVGLFGHSTGGGAVYEVADTDPRVKCVFGLDTWTEPISQDVRDKPLSVPFYSLRSAAWAQNPDAKATILHDLIAKAKGPVYDYYLADSKHADFTLMPLLSPFAGRLGMTGPIDGHRALEITDAYLLAFFDQYLRGKESPLLQPGATTFAEVKPAPNTATNQAASK